jgi:hypothetical protein
MQLLAFRYSSEVPAKLELQGRVQFVIRQEDVVHEFSKSLIRDWHLLVMERAAWKTEMQEGD